MKLKVDPSMMYQVGVGFSDSLVVSMGKHFHKDVLLLDNSFKNNTINFTHKVK